MTAPPLPPFLRALREKAAAFADLPPIGCRRRS
jgi:hypothetical protein